MNKISPFDPSKPLSSIKINDESKKLSKSKPQASLPSANSNSLDTHIPHIQRSTQEIVSAENAFKNLGPN